MDVEYTSASLLTRGLHGWSTNPLQQPHYLIVNLAIGGTQGGDPSKTRFPARYEIDYVRVYQRRPSKE